MTQAKRTRIVFFYAITGIASFLLALLIVETVLRSIDYSNGINIGTSAHQRWQQKHWKPVNELGYRDVPLGKRLQASAPRIYFLGDSFTAGSGVDFNETFYYQSIMPVIRQYNPFNLGKTGASTRTELADIKQFDQTTGAHATIVVHQYFINDIEDEIPRFRWQPSPWLLASARYLESMQFVLAYRMNQEFGQEYKARLTAAYTNPATLQRHFDDLAALHHYIRQQQGRVIFLLFPALGSDAELQGSAVVLQQLRHFFAKTCQPGDMLIDATASAQKLSSSERVVSLLDAHPSVALHKLVGKRITQAIEGDDRDILNASAYETCDALRQDQQPIASGAP